MANWCYSGITFYSEKEQAITEFAKKLNEICNGKPTQENSFGKGWMGDFANVFYPSIGAEHIDCRGRLCDIDIGAVRVGKFFYLSICTETAWDAKIGLWYKILQDFYPDMKLAYAAEESGNLYFVKWDETGLFYPHDFYMDMAYPNNDGDIAYLEDHEFGSMKEIYDWLVLNVPFEYEKKESACELDWEIRSKLDKYNSDEFFCNIAEYTKIDPSEFDFKINRR